MNIEALHSITKSLPAGVRLVAVSKYHPQEDIMKAYGEGQRIFGENHVQEVVAKQMVLPKDIEWHFIGHLQTNKVGKIAPFISMIHSVDSFRLLKEINKQAAKNGRVIPCLLQLHVAQEETKFGFTIDECRLFLEAGEWKALANVQISGLMCMATNTDDTKRVRADFHAAHEAFNEFKARFFSADRHFTECSWGMSHDYITAIEEGSTLVRIGTTIFGERHYDTQR